MTELSAPTTRKRPSANRDVLISSGAIAGQIDDTLPSPAEALYRLLASCDEMERSGDKPTAEVRHDAAMLTAERVMFAYACQRDAHLDALRSLHGAALSLDDARYIAAREDARKLVGSL